MSTNFKKENFDKNRNEINTIRIKKRTITCDLKKMRIKILRAKFYWIFF